MKLAVVMVSLAAFLVAAAASAQGRFHRAPVRHGVEHHAPRVHHENRRVHHPVVVHRPMHRR